MPILDYVVGTLASLDLNSSTHSCLSGAAVAVAAGYLHSCGVISGGQVLCWGHNGNGQLGTDDTLDLLSPTPVPIGAGLCRTKAQSFDVILHLFSALDLGLHFL